LKGIEGTVGSEAPSERPQHRFDVEACAVRCRGVPESARRRRQRGEDTVAHPPAGPDNENRWVSPFKGPRSARDLVRSKRQRNRSENGNVAISKSQLWNAHMCLSLNFEWEEAPGKKTLSNPSPPRPAADFQDAPAKQTARQSAFYRNLIRLAEQMESKILPIAFTTIDGSAKRMDYGCIKIAEHAGFIEPLSNNVNGVVDVISLTWDPSLRATRQWLNRRWHVKWRTKNEQLRCQRDSDADPTPSRRLSDRP
jgi:hypothetical protein